MFGTVFRLRPQPGQEGPLIDLMSELSRDHVSAAAGWVGTYVLRSRTTPGELVGLAVFESEAAYYRNAADPDLDRRYRQWRSLLTTDPVWEDGAIDAVVPDALA